MIAPHEAETSDIDLMAHEVITPRSEDEPYSSPTPSAVNDGNDDASNSQGRTGEESSAAVEIAEKETRLVRFQRIVVFLVLLLCCTLAASFTYVFMSQDQENDFRTEFNSYASEMIEVTKHNSETIFDVIAQFSVTTTSFALYDKAIWPAVTIPDFEARSTAFRQATRAQFLAVLPAVERSHDSLEAWGNYSMAHQGWIQESRAYTELHHAGHGEDHGDGHGDEHDTEHGDSHGEDHGDDHGDEHGDDHGDAHDEDHGEEHVEAHGEHVATEDHHIESGVHSEEHTEHSATEEDQHTFDEEELTEGDDHSDEHTVDHSVAEEDHNEGEDNGDVHSEEHAFDTEEGHTEDNHNIHNGEYATETGEDGNHTVLDEVEGEHHDMDDEGEHYVNETGAVELHEATGHSPTEEHHVGNETGLYETFEQVHESNETEQHRSTETSHLRRRGLQQATHVDVSHAETTESADHSEHDTDVFSLHNEEEHETTDMQDSLGENSEHSEHDTNILDIHSEENHDDHENSDTDGSHGDTDILDLHDQEGHGEHDDHGASLPTTISDHIYHFVNERAVHETEAGTGRIAPLWQAGPVPPNIGLVNFNMLSIPLISQVFNSVIETRLPVLSQVLDLTEVFSEAGSQAFVEHLHGEEAGEVPHPESLVLQPIFKDLGANPEIVGALLVALPWNVFFDNLLNGKASVFCVVKNKCGQTFTYLIEGQKSIFLGNDDLHDPEFDDYERSTDFTEFDNGVAHIDTEEHDNHAEHQRVQEDHFDHDEEVHVEDHENAYDDTHHESFTGRCDYTLSIYPTQELKSNYESNKPAIFTIVVVLIFAFTSFVFILYDFLVERRQKTVMDSANKTGAIVSSLFPSNVHDRLFDTANEKKVTKTELVDSNQFKLDKFMGDPNGGDYGDEDVLQTKPIADLFPNTTIMFADLVGFTSWSSKRSPEDVFVLLETLFRAFDAIAKRRRVFKVETIGDCYVAVCGLPTPRKDHALVMSRFAIDIQAKMDYLTRKLEITLGPGTGALLMRVGLHSGPVTAGVLRGEKSRFQLFGDTMNTASRMESTGKKDHIQMSQETAILLIAAGKSSWIVPREDKVIAKGKGEMDTYWLVLKGEQSCATASSFGSLSHDDMSEGFDDFAAAVAASKKRRVSQGEELALDSGIDEVEC